MSTEVYSRTYGRSIAGYDLLDDVQEILDCTDQEAHEFVWNSLDQIAAIDGEDEVFLSSRPVRSELERYNPHDLDRPRWHEVSDAAATDILTAAQSQADLNVATGA